MCSWHALFQLLQPVENHDHVCSHRRASSRPLKTDEASPRQWIERARRVGREVEKRDRLLRDGPKRERWLRVDLDHLERTARTSVVNERPTIRRPRRMVAILSGRL